MSNNESIKNSSTLNQIYPPQKYRTPNYMHSHYNWTKIYLINRDEYYVKNEKTKLGSTS